jgi:hypothetical protein
LFFFTNLAWHRMPQWGALERLGVFFPCERNAPWR